MRMATAKGNGTLIEVARACDVSQSTVSRVLNNAKAGRFSVSPEVRERILQAAREMNYRPSFAARNLAVNKTKLVAVLGVAGIWSDRVGPVEEAVGATAAALDKAGYELCVQMLSQRHGPFDLPAVRVDGVVAVGPRHLADLRDLESSDIPYVSLNGVTGPRGSLAVADDAKGTALALQHLVDIGHRRIAYLDHWSVDATHPSVYERRNAFASQAQLLGFTPVDVGLPMLPAETAWDSFYEPFARRAIVEGKATAVLAYSHQGALGLLRTAHDMGLRCPKDFSLVCFNDEPVVRLAIPSITAVNVPSVKMGQVTAELLLRQMTSDSPPPPEHIRLPESLVVRESSAPPATDR